MSLFENFPWTNLHQLNLNWLIEEVKKCYSPDNPPEAMVISVNGESGVVTLYRDAHINFPDVDAVQWNLYRGTDGVITGIEFNKNAPATRINGNQRFVIYDAGNPPPYPVVSVNGETGAVTLYSEAYVEFPDLEGDNWGVQRKLNANTANETIVGLMLNDDGDLSVLKDENSIPVYTSENPPPYPVRTVDGMTGNVNTWGYSANSKINIPIPANVDEWSIGRVIDQGGNLSIKIMYDDNIQKCTAHMVYDDGVNNPILFKLLTNEDIPSSSGVVSINGNTGVITIYASNLNMSQNDNRTIENVVNGKTDKTVITAHIENSTTASRNYVTNDLILVNGVLKRATTNISVSDTLNTTNTTDTTIETELNNIRNALNSINTSHYNTVALNNNFAGTGSIVLMGCGKIRTVFGHLKPTNSGAGQLAATLHVGDRPPMNIEAPISGYAEGCNGEILITADGDIKISVDSAPQNTAKFNVTFAIDN